MIEVIKDRWKELEHWHLKKGSHEENKDGELCVMEAVAYVYGKDWTDSPACVSPVIAAFMRSWNDWLPSDEERDRLLKPLITDLVMTADSKLEDRRSYMALDWLVRVHTPKFLDLVPALQGHAKSLRDLEEIADMAGAQAAGKKTDAAWAAAWAAARDVARDAAWAAAGDAARDAARAAAWDAAWDAARDAARAAAWDAARAAAWAAAWAAAGDAAGDALAPTVSWLQDSAQDLVRKMCALSHE